MIYITDNRNRRLCNDGEWRVYALYGEYPKCVKMYVKLGWAKRMVASINGRNSIRFAKVIHVPKDGRNIRLSSVGDLTEEVPSNRKDYRRFIPLDIKKFIVES